MFKLNLTSFFLIGLVFLLGLFLIQTKLDNKEYRKSFNKKMIEYSTIEYNLNNKYRKERAKLTDSIDYYKSLVAEYQKKIQYSNNRISDFKRNYAIEKAEVDEKPINDVYGSLTSGNLAIGQTNWGLADNQVRQLEKQRLSLDECSLIRREQEIEIHYLDESIKATGEIIVNQDKEICMMDSTISALQINFDDINSKNKILKRKIWSNRGIAALATGLVVVVLL